MAISVSDILKILEKVPDWTRLKKLPEQVEELEARVAELEKLLKQSQHLDCEYCGKGAMRKVAIEPTQEVPDIGVRVETWRCQECGEIDHRVAPPK